jgi:dephospho-CoA kinase
MPVAAKAELADYVVVNNGTRRLLEEQVERVLKSMCER